MEPLMNARFFGGISSFISWNVSDNGPNEFVTAVYEAVDVLGQILNRSLQEKTSLSGRALASHALNRSFAAELREVFIDMFGERKSLHCVADFNVNNNTFQNVMVYKTSEHSFTAFDKGEIDWSGSMGAPPNEPRCGYTGDRCDTSQHWIGATVGKVLGAAAGVLLAGPGFLVLALRNSVTLDLYVAVKPRDTQ
ncbi:hypothetical protein RvY_08531 [Ramazzottius varieornatus]|uniref:Receptor ligand binding region domain-containing protein n=1 Tax=Ramazzottius varieornatus TaxID=947166 RepID=A0A1D1V644_RAMVA|nr:hypothetical protein RvY_08531 [Ramazzottius varieornatus]